MTVRAVDAGGRQGLTAFTYHPVQDLVAAERKVFVANGSDDSLQRQQAENRAIHA